MKYPTLESARPHSISLAACLLGTCLLMAGCGDGGSSSNSGDDITDVSSSDSDTGTDTDGTDTGNETDSSNVGDGTDGTAASAAITAGLRINEIVASNQSGLLDEDGDMSDWMELYNPSDVALDLTGWHLSDDMDDLTKWTLPPVSLAADGYLIVFASDKDRAAAGAELHTNFRLTADGEYLGLSNPAGTVIVDEFAPSFPALAEDQAYGVRSDGTVDLLSAPTPGAANVP